MRILLAHPLCTVVHGSWQDLVEHVPAVDHSITDPPYTEHVHGSIRSLDLIGGIRIKKWEPGFAPLEGFAHWQWQLSITRAWALNFCALEQMGDYKDAALGFRSEGGYYVRSWIWRKGQAAPQLSGNCPANSCEGIAVAHAKGGRMRWNGRGKHAWWDGGVEEIADGSSLDNVVFSNRDRLEKRHPNQKPAALCDDLISKFTQPGDLIGDWFCGSGAIAARSLVLGRRAIACDADEGWATFTAERCARILAGDLSREPKKL